MWNEGKGPMDEGVSVWKDVQTTLNDQKILEWQAHKDQSMSSSITPKLKTVRGKRFILSLG